MSHAGHKMVKYIFMSKTFTLRKTVFIVLIAALLIFSFGLHTIDVTHTHHHPAGTEGHSTTPDGFSAISEYVHGIEQKFLLLLLAIIYIGGTALALRYALPNPTYVDVLLFGALLFSIHTYTKRVYCEHYITDLFRTGILHPKLH